MRRICTFLIIVFLFLGCQSYGPKPIPHKEVKPVAPITLPVSNALSPKAASLLVSRKVEIPPTNTLVVNTLSNTEAVIVKSAVEIPVFQVSNNKTNKLVPEAKPKRTHNFSFTFLWYVISTSMLTVAWYLFGKKRPKKAAPKPQVEKE